MQVHVNIQQEKIAINEAFQGSNADEIVGKIKARVAKELPFALRLAVGAMNNLQFAQEIVKRYNQNKQTNLAIPQSCEQFLQTAQTQGFAQIS